MGLAGLTRLGVHGVVCIASTLCIPYPRYTCRCIYIRVDIVEYCVLYTPCIHRYSAYSRPYRVFYTIPYGRTESPGPSPRHPIPRSFPGSHPAPSQFAPDPLHQLLISTLNFIFSFNFNFLDSPPQCHVIPHNDTSIMSNTDHICIRLQSPVYVYRTAQE